MSRHRVQGAAVKKWTLAYVPQDRADLGDQVLLESDTSDLFYGVYDFGRETASVLLKDNPQIARRWREADDDDKTRLVLNQPQLDELEAVLVGAGPLRRMPPMNDPSETRAPDADEVERARRAVAAGMSEEVSNPADIEVLVGHLRNSSILGLPLQVAFCWAGQTGEQASVKRLLRWKVAAGQRPLIGPTDTVVYATPGAESKQAIDDFGRFGRVATNVSQLSHKLADPILPPQPSIEIENFRASPAARSRVSRRRFHLTFVDGDFPIDLAPRDAWLPRTAALVVSVRGEHSIAHIRRLRAIRRGSTPIFLADPRSVRLWQAFSGQPRVEQLRSCVQALAAASGREAARDTQVRLRSFLAGVHATGLNPSDWDSFRSAIQGCEQAGAIEQAVDYVLAA